MRVIPLKIRIKIRNTQSQKLSFLLKKRVNKILRILFVQVEES